MHTKQLIGAVMLVLCYAGTAYAELVTGRVTSIDSTGQNITLRRADNNGTMTVHVADLASLNGLEAGHRVNVDTSRNGDIVEAQFFKLVDDPSSRSNAGQGVDVNATSSTSTGNRALKSNSLISNSLANTNNTAGESANE